MEDLAKTERQSDKKFYCHGIKIEFKNTVRIIATQLVIRKDRSG